MAFQSGRRLLWAAVAVGSLAAATSAVAHHSAGAFDRTKEMTVTGSVKTFRWANPHPMMTIVAESPGAAGDYLFEYPAPAQMLDRGWTRSFAKVGDKVTIKYNPWRSGANGGLFQDITAADGKSLKARQ